MRLCLAAAVVVALLPLPAAAQNLDGLPPVGVPPAPALSGTDIVPVCQGGTAGVPGTCTVRRTTVSAFTALISATSFSSPPPIGNVAPNTGAFTALSATGDATIGGTLGVTGATTLSGGGTLSGNFLGLPTFIQKVAFNAPISLSSAVAFSGASGTPTNANTGLLQAVTLSGFASDGGPMDANFQRVVYTGTNANGFSAFRLAGSVTGGFGAGVAVEATSDNLGFSGTGVPAWVTGTAYAVGQVVKSGTSTMRATTAATSGVTPPNCSISVSTCSDGAVSWSYVNEIFNTQQLIGLLARSNALTNYGGTAGGGIGNVFGVNSLAGCKTTFLASCIGYENDFGISAGNSAYERIGEQIVISQGSSVQGSVVDVGWRIGAQAGSAPLDFLMSWGTPNNPAVIQPTGYGLRAYPSGGGTGTPSLMAGAGAVDLTEFSASGAGVFGGGFLLRGPNSQLLGNGDVQSGPAVLHTTATGASLDAGVWHMTGVALVSGGTGWTCTGKWADGADGSVVQITSVLGGAVTGISLVLGGWASTPPANPVTFTPEQQCGAPSTSGYSTPPSSFTVNETWTQANGGAPVLTLGGTASVSVATATVLTPSLPTAAPATHCALWVNTGVVTRTTCP
jgi:hypothetical protein